MSDIELVRLAQSGDKRAERVILDRYQYLAHVKARSYFLNGAEHKDTVQEAMFGLYKAIKDFNEQYKCSFRSFAILCITRQIITAVKLYARKKHNPLSSYQSLDNLDIEVPDEPLLDRLALQYTDNSRTKDPLILFIAKEELDMVIAILQNELSILEWSIFVEYLCGNGYQEIADKTGCSNTKIVDNALCRVKEKVRHYLNSPECLEEELKKLKEKEEKEMAKKGPNRYAFFLQTVCSKDQKTPMSRIDATAAWSRFTLELKEKWDAAAHGTGPIPVYKGHKPKAKRKPGVKEPVVEPEMASKSEETVLQNLLSIIEQRSELADKVREVVLEALESEAEILEQKLAEVRTDISSLQ